MKSYIFALAALAAGVAATTTAVAPEPSSSSSCAAQNILDACLGTENSQLSGCETSDYNCQCNAWKNIVTCYNNCPGDQSVSTAQGQVEIFCAYATEFTSSTAAATASGSASQSAPASTGAATTTGTATGTATGAAASASKTNAAADVALNAGGVLVAVAAGVAALL